MGDTHQRRFSRVQYHPKETMLKAVALVCLLAAAVAIPRDNVISIDQDNHKHDQQGTPGKAVTGSYQVVNIDGSVRTVNYIADERGFRVIGDAQPAEIPRPAPPAPTRAPTRAPTQAPYQAPTTGYYYPPPSDDYLPPQANSFFSVFDV